MRAAPMGSYVCIQVPQLVELFGGGLGVVVLLEVVPLNVDTEVSKAHSQCITPCLLLMDQDVSSQLLLLCLPAAMLPAMMVMGSPSEL